MSLYLRSLLTGYTTTNISMKNKTRITQATWGDLSKELANGFRAGGQIDPKEHSPAGIERFMFAMKDYVYDVKNVRSDFKSINNAELISFQSDWARDYYGKAWERFQLEAAKVDKTTPEGKFRILVEFLQFRKAAEFCRADVLADRAYAALQSGQDAVLAVNFKQTIVRATRRLIKVYGLKRSDISLIWGGSSELTSGGKGGQAVQFSEDEIASILQKMIAAGANKEQQDLVLKKLRNPAVETPEEKEAREFAILNKFGPQNRVARQEEIDRFQSGQSRVAMFTFKSGGVGLSLHHTDEWAKVDKATGNKIVKSRQRRAFLAPTYSAIEIVQGLGRAHRLTSLTDTEQTILFYRGTIEEAVYAIVNLKMRCLRKVTQAKESWDSLITEAKKESDFISEEDKNAVSVGTDNVADLQNDMTEGEDEEEE
jgi:hypothetical protein